MTDNEFNRDTRKERPVWSHKTEDGYLESFLKGETESGPEASAAASDEAEAETSAQTEAQAPQASGNVETAGEPPLEEKIVAAIRQIFDPEIPVNIYDLGLIYGVEVDDHNNVDVTMTLTTPHCPVAESLPMEVESKVRSVEGVNDVDLDVVWDPPWDMTKMSDEARLELGLL